MKKKSTFLILAMVVCLAMLPASAETDAHALLQSIDSLGQVGWVLNAPYKVESDTIDVAIDDLGTADHQDYVASAKGTYYTYDAEKLVFGVNKGDQIFEIRSFDDRLAEIRLSDVTGYFGDPEHLTRSDTGSFVSYQLTDDLNIKFVFPRVGMDPVVSHYCIIYPAGTVNMMADDPGREW